MHFLLSCLVCFITVWVKDFFFHKMFIILLTFICNVLKVISKKLQGHHVCIQSRASIFHTVPPVLTVHRTCHSAKQCCLLKLKFRYSWECLTIHFHYNSVSIWLSVVLRDRKAFFWSTNGFRRWDVFILMTFSGMMPKPSSV